MRASLSAIFAATALHRSSSNTHFPFFRHAPQLTHERTGALPIWMISVSTPCFSNCEAISLNAQKVLPSCLGLPLIINTFIFPIDWVGVVLSGSVSKSPEDSTPAIMAATGDAMAVPAAAHAVFFMNSRLSIGAKGVVKDSVATVLQESMSYITLAPAAPFVEYR